MRIAFTDFDGTLYRERRVLASDVAAIHDWRRAGSLFGIATGRDRSMILYEIEKWEIPFDFLVCNNGAAIYDRSLATLASRDIPNDTVRGIMLHSAAAASVHWQICAGGNTRLLINSDRSWFPGLGVPYEEVDREQALSTRGVQQISFAYDSDTECLGHIGALEAAFGRDILPQQNGAFVDITAPGASKAAGIADLAARMAWRDPDVYVIGDSENDLSMIRRHEGFAVPNARDAVLAAAAGVFPSVGAMLDAAREGIARNTERRHLRA